MALERKNLKTYEEIGEVVYLLVKDAYRKITITLNDQNNYDIKAE